MNYLTDYYETHDEDGRLSLSKHGQVEFLTTMKYLRDYLTPGMRVLEIGAGTGRYSLTLARQGFRVHAIELVRHNLDILRSKALPGDDIVAEEGNALDLSRFPDGSFDAALLLGPMYHLYGDEDKIQALSEAKRVTKPGGILFVAYCMNEASVVVFGFQKGNMPDLLAKDMLTEDFHCITRPVDVFEMVRTEDIERLNAAVGLERLKLVATDGATLYMRETIDAMDDETFALWMRYHLATCERQDLIGASNHALDVLRV